MYNVDSQKSSNECILQACIDDWEWDIETKKIIESAYLFGSGNDVCFIFDLRTYTEQDQSCDIYGIVSEEEIIYYLGRDFFVFIRDICIERKFGDKFPELFIGIGDDEIKKDSIAISFQVFLPVSQSVSTTKLSA